MVPEIPKLVPASVKVVPPDVKSVFGVIEVITGAA